MAFVDVCKRPTTFAIRITKNGYNKVIICHLLALRTWFSRQTGPISRGVPMWTRRTQHNIQVQPLLPCTRPFPHSTPSFPVLLYETLSLAPFSPLHLYPSPFNGVSQCEVAAHLDAGPTGPSGSQAVQSAPVFYYTAPTLISLHWLPVSQRITYKLRWAWWTRWYRYGWHPHRCRAFFFSHTFTRPSTPSLWVGADGRLRCSECPTPVSDVDHSSWPDQTCGTVFQKSPDVFRWHRLSRVISTRNCFISIISNWAVLPSLRRFSSHFWRLEHLYVKRFRTRVRCHSHRLLFGFYCFTIVRSPSYILTSLSIAVHIV